MIRCLPACLFFALSLSAAEPDVPSELLALGSQTGLCVDLGCGDATLAATLASKGNLVIHALETSDAQVSAACESLQQKKLYGQVSVEKLSSKELPYADNLINVLIAEKDCGVSDAEIMRVLTPNGVAWFKRDGKWISEKKAWPKGLDEWTHWRHAADGNMVSGDTELSVPSGPRWIAGPPQDAGGRKWYYDHVLLSSKGRNFYVFDKSIAARDAFNGRLLWTLETTTPTFKENAVPGTGKRISKVRPVADGDRLFAIIDDKLCMLDARTGKTLKALANVDEPREILFSDGVLLISDNKSLRALTPDGQQLWEFKEQVKRVLAGDDSVFCVFGQSICRLDLKTSSERWRTTNPKAAEASTCTYFNGTLVLERSTWVNDPAGSGIVVFSGESGEKLWGKDYKPGMTHYQETRAFFAGDLLWLELENSKCGGYEPLTGKLVKEYGSRGLHCAVPVATKRFLIAPEMEFTNLETGEQKNAHMVKSACRISYVPANGMLYTFPVQCECFPMLRGYMGLEPDRKISNKPEEPRLEKGPAFGLVKAAAIRDEEWPTYRHDAWRSGSTNSKIHEGLKQVWETQLAAEPASTLLGTDWKDDPFIKGPISAPTVANGLVYVAASDTHRVVALDASNGATRWSFTCGGRVDTPPTIADGVCLFGSHDGWVYALNAASGELAWRFRGAPRERRIAVYAQMESPWPVPGSVLVDNGVAYIAAGRHPGSDGGVHVIALKPQTGEMLWEKIVTESGVKRWYGEALPLPNLKRKIGVDYEPMDMLVKDGDHVSMSRWQFATANGDVKLAVDELEYKAYKNLSVPRGLWGYGIRQTKLVYEKPAAVFDASKVYIGGKTDVALLMAGGTLVTATNADEIKIGAQTIHLDADVIRDGMACAYGSLFVSTSNGKLRRFGN